jgi:hypothetical protein
VLTTQHAARIRIRGHPRSQSEDFLHDEHYGTTSAAAGVDAVGHVTRLARVLIVRVGFTAARAVCAGTRRALAVVVVYAIVAHSVLAKGAVQRTCVHALGTGTTA